ncbi:hypothetical protein LTR84_005129 [Exophiala bonariae]|uniref:Uncharacterized protein n=1 Tax=Exophiala bonariae TaxID=1690606 RepID=A0AAV9NPJ4_9EURO|nr:hypothetical protein LTR84_005129 [Exophiala bonariae]
MKSTLAQAAAFLSSLASAAIIPSSSPTSNSSAKDITTVAGTTGSDYVSINFSAPCQGCFTGTDDGVELSLEIDSADEECTSNPPRLNGLPLTTNNGNGNQVTKGQLIFKSKPSNGVGEKEVHAFWESICLKGEASILSVRFDDLNGDIGVTGASGFTTSFKQKGQPTVLRLQDRPVENLSDDSHICDMWLNPDESSKLSITAAPQSVAVIDNTLELQYAKLDDLKAQLADLHEELLMTESTIMSLVKEEFRSCTSLKCIWDTAKSKAPGICKLITAHFSHHPSRVSGCTEGDAQSPCRTQAQDLSPMQKKPPQTAEVPENVETKPEISSSSAASSPTPSPPIDESEDLESLDSKGLSESSPNDDGDTPWVQSTGTSGIATFQIDTSRIQASLRRHLTLAVVSLILLALIGGLTFRVVRFLRDPRRRAELAARREERYTKRLYRKAACQHAWRKWWRQFKLQATGDYEEKREMILEQEGISQDTLQRQILTLSDATDLVRNLIAAEEGRVQAEHRALPARYQSNPQSPYTSPLYDAVIGSSQMSETLPPYPPPPPGYEEQLEGEVTVVHGFSSSASTTDDATESSIVDCSPRLSFETGRSTILTRDARD